MSLTYFLKSIFVQGSRPSRIFLFDNTFPNGDLIENEFEHVSHTIPYRSTCDPLYYAIHAELMLEFVKSCQRKRKYQEAIMVIYLTCITGKTRGE